MASVSPRLTLRELERLWPLTVGFEVSGDSSLSGRLFSLMTGPGSRVASEKGGV